MALTAAEFKKYMKQSLEKHVGTDIHVFVEKFDEETKTWFMTKHEIEGAERRNYAFFGALANVRTWDDDPSREPKGLPEDASLGILDENKRWGTDSHSRSWETLERFLELLKKHSYDFQDAKIADLRVRQNNLNKDEEAILNRYRNFENYVADWSCAWNSDIGAFIPDTNLKFRVAFWFDS